MGKLSKGKWLAIVLALAMVLSLVPVVAAGNSLDTGTDKYASDETTMVIRGNVDGATYPYAAVPANAGPHYGADTWINQTGSNNWDPVPTWIWESMPVENPVDGDIVWFEKSFEVVGTPTEGALKIACDNGYAVWLNGKFVGNSATLPLFVGADLNGNYVEFEAMLGDLKQQYVTTSGWQTVGNFDLTDHLVEGTNVLTVLGVNEYMWTDDANDPEGTVDLNPGGLAFSFTVDWEMPPPPCDFRTQGYWKNHPDMWPAFDLHPEVEECGTKDDFFGQGTWMEVLWTPPAGGDAYYILAHQFIAAFLNVQSGCVYCEDVGEALYAAGEYFHGEGEYGEYGEPGVLTGGRLGADERDAREAVLGWAEILDNWNNSLCDCDDCD